MTENNYGSLKGYKATELGNLPEDWEISNLGSICKVTTGKKDVNEGNPSGEYPFFTCADKISRSDSYSFDTEAILIAGNGDVGNTKYYCGKFEAYQRTYVLYDFVKYPIYIYFYLKGNIKSALKIKKSGSTMPYVHKGDLTNFRLPLPPLAEQKVIASILQTVEEAKEKTEEVIRATKELKKSMMKHLFTYGPVPPGEAENVKLKETEIGPMPEEWEVVKLGKLAQIRYGLGQPPSVDENGIAIIRATNIKKGRIVREGLLRVRLNEIPLSRNPFLKSGEIIVVRSGAYTGDVAMVTSEWEGSIAGYDLVVTPSKQMFSPFCSQYLLSDFVQKYFRSQRDRSAQPHINSHQLSNTLIPFLPLSIQQEVGEILSSIDAKIEAEENKKKAIEELFKTLLHDLMTAKIRIKTLEV